jgi:hypothetical protein
MLRGWGISVILQLRRPFGGTGSRHRRGTKLKTTVAMQADHMMVPEVRASAAAKR